MDAKFRKLIELGAGEFEHAEPALIEQLESTRCLLKSWSASQVLQDAGLYHVAYCMERFDTPLFDLSRRQDVVEVVGPEVENIIYHYHACDNNLFFAKLAQDHSPTLFYDRYTNSQSPIGHMLIKDICELTAAIEIDKAMHKINEKSHSDKLESLLTQIETNISLSAQRKFKQLLCTTEV
ncbi:DUF6817 domain-containing protein [Paraglaciecola sp.]|uniref:DUF6817 domain-containing protein n=1 Tax=Paraglaciecola sp. TaxID=1920173 RepID=UPI003EF71804